MFSYVLRRKTMTSNSAGRKSARRQRRKANKLDLLGFLVCLLNFGFRSLLERNSPFHFSLAKCPRYSRVGRQPESGAREINAAVLCWFQELEPLFLWPRICIGGVQSWSNVFNSEHHIGAKLSACSKQCTKLNAC